jgi:DNA-binding protein H-NS
MNILEKADAIVNHRNEEKERQYGPFKESMKKTAEIASILCSKEITTEDVYKILISLKASRLSYSHKEDTLLDLVAYVGALNNYYNE